MITSANDSKAPVFEIESSSIMFDTFDRQGHGATHASILKKFLDILIAERNCSIMSFIKRKFFFPPPNFPFFGTLRNATQPTPDPLETWNFGSQISYKFANR